MLHLTESSYDPRSREALVDSSPLASANTCVSSLTVDQHILEPQQLFQLLNIQNILQPSQLHTLCYPEHSPNTKALCSNQHSYSLLIHLCSCEHSHNASTQVLAHYVLQNIALNMHIPLDLQYTILTNILSHTGKIHKLNEDSMFIISVSVDIYCPWFLQSVTIPIAYCLCNYCPKSS